MKNSKLKIWAVVPARSGSKSVKNKNIKNFDGLPLLAHTINSAKFSNSFERIFLLTDSKKYAKIGKKFGAEIPFIRPKKISHDKSTDNELYMYFINFFRQKKIKLPSYIAHLSPTVPLRLNKVIEKGIRFFLKNKKKNSSMRSVSEMSQPSYKTMRIINNKLCSIIKKDFDLNKLNKPRQSYTKTYIPNGLIDILSTKFLIENKKTHGKSVIPYITNQFFLDIDTQSDFELAKIMIKKIKYKSEKYNK